MKKTIKTVNELKLSLIAEQIVFENAICNIFEKL